MLKEIFASAGLTLATLTATAEPAFGQELQDTTSKCISPSKATPRSNYRLWVQINPGSAELVVFNTPYEPCQDKSGLWNVYDATCQILDPISGPDPLKDALDCNSHARRDTHFSSGGFIFYRELLSLLS